MLLTLCGNLIVTPVRRASGMAMWCRRGEDRAIDANESLKPSICEDTRGGHSPGHVLVRQISDTQGPFEGNEEKAMSS